MTKNLEIEKEYRKNMLQVNITGRLDAYWSNNLATALEEEVRSGHYHIALNLSRVDFISSAGIRVLVQFYKQLKSLGGCFTVLEPSRQVETVLEMVGMGAIFLTPANAPEAASDATGVDMAGNGIAASVTEINKNAGFTCSLTGNPALIHTGGFSAGDCRTISFPSGKLGLGLGAMGHDFNDCRGRFGEFIAIGGTVAYLPGDGNKQVDYGITTGNYIPDLKVLYGLTCEGEPSHLITFETREASGSISCSNLLEEICASRELKDFTSLGIVIVAETNGLVGTALIRSPLSNEVNTSPFTFPQLRENINLTTEKAYSNMLALATGIITRQPSPELVPFVRPLRPRSIWQGHIHCAVFPYRPLKKKNLDLADTISTLYETGQIPGLLHLLYDDREIIGAGESEFIQGSCWVGGITGIVKERQG